MDEVMTILWQMSAWDGLSDVKKLQSLSVNLSAGQIASWDKLSNVKKLQHRMQSIKGQELSMSNLWATQCDQIWFHNFDEFMCD